MKHLKEEWFLKSLEAHNKGAGNIYTFNSFAIQNRCRAYYEKKLNDIDTYDRYFVPNPYTYQYDLLVECWINFKDILNEEVVILRKRAIKEKRPAFNDIADSLVASNMLYGVKREDFMYGACELRWPSNFINGSYQGPLVRDPWMEEKTEAFSDQTYKYIIAFGGGGQGKTLTFIALNLVIWDHYIFTQKGARCMISTVSKEKLNSASWSYLQQLVRSTQKGISLYAGQGVIAGDYTIRRPNNKDAAGVYKGILLAERIDDTEIVDKLTGSHGHPWVGYIMDEMQSTSSAPITASANFTIHAKDFRVCGAGNYNEDTDTLGKNVKPSTGWDTVDQDTKRWVSYMQNNQMAITLHFSNDRSPGMTKEGEKLYPYLPNEAKKKRIYPKAAARSLENKQYRRFWIGWRIENAESDTVITKSSVEATGCDKPLNLSSVLQTFFSFDSAQGEGDRNLLGEFKDGIDVESKERVWGVSKLYESFKSSDALSYYTESSDWILSKAKIAGVKSGQMILDWTGRPAQAEIMQRMGFDTIQLTYNAGVPDGKRKDVKTKRVMPAIVIDPSPENRLFAHQVAYNSISLGAWLLQQYIQSGRVRGINEQMLEYLTTSHDINEELYSRKFYEKNSKEYGSLFVLSTKKDFKSQYGFSPDLLDILFQAAYYMFVHRHLPISPLSSFGKSDNYDLDLNEEMEDHAEVWEDDLIEEYEYGY